MDTERTKILLDGSTSSNTVNSNTYLKISLDGKQKLLPSDDNDYVVSLAKQFDTERQCSTFYRILGTINSTISNALFNLNDTVHADLYTYSGFNYLNTTTGIYRFIDTKSKTDNTYSLALDTYLKENEGWFGYFNPNLEQASLCNFFDMEPKRERFSFIPDISPFIPTSFSFVGIQPVNNWELTITYPASIDSGHTMVIGGLLIAEAIPATVSNRIMTAFSVACSHNLIVGDIVRLTGTTGYNNDYVVVRVGLDNGDLPNNYFVVDTPPTGSVSFNSRMIRLVGGIESQYYFRKFKKIKTRNFQIIQTDDYEMYKCGFSENVFYDAVTQFIFNDDIDVSNLVDNLGRPLSQLYLTIIKTNSNGLFTPVSSGIETPYIPILKSNIPYIKNIPAINLIYNGTNSLTPLETNITINPISNEFYGDLVEYNTNELKEIVLADVHHRFNTLNRETAPTLNYLSSFNTTASFTSVVLGPRHEGYYYKAHKLIQIREFSSYIEQGDQFTIDVPSYAVNLGDGRYLWRGLLPIGFNESNTEVLDYPFTNGCHYMYDTYSFSLRRQDPFANWGLYWSNYPADPVGSTMDVQFISNSSSNNVC